jgi:PAS domain S-box-containing protein
VTGELQERLPNRDELFQMIVEDLTDFAIFTMDAQGLVTSWNSGAERLFGYSEREIVGSTGNVIFIPEERNAGVPEREREIARAQGRATDERWHLRKDGSRFWASGLMMMVKAADGFVKICRDRTAQHLAEEQLRRSEQRFRLLATSIPQLVFLSRPDGTRTWPSPQWIDFTGVGFDESLGHGWMEAIHSEDRQRTQEAWKHAVAKGEYYVEHRVRRQADGEYRWHQTRARPIDHGNADMTTGEWVGTMTDIHSFRQIQERQHVLMRELQHRTRNLLAVVLSIATRTQRSSRSLEEFASEFNGRLQSLSRVQSLLARVEEQSVELQALVEAELAAHADSRNDKVIVKGPTVHLPAMAAQALGLAIHELATNASKYGALAQPSGKLVVSWDLKEGPVPHVLLEWIEKGVAMPIDPTPRRKGYGTELIQRALPYQLGADTNLEFGRDGVRCSIKVLIPTGSHA